MAFQGAAIRRTLLPRPTLIARYSTSNTPWGDVTDILDQESRKFPRSTPKRSFAAGNDALVDKRIERWKLFAPCQVLRPHDLTYKSRLNAPRAYFLTPPGVAPPTKITRENDIFYKLDIDPLSQATNSSILAQFVTEMGKIRGRAYTGLTTKTQRKLGKAIRRAKMMGVIPILSKPRKTLQDLHSS